MVKWHARLELNDVYHSGKPIQELAAIVALRLRRVGVPDGDTHLAGERDLIAERFESLSEDEEASVDEFDEVMSELYDWADTPLDPIWPCGKLCWVATR